MEIDNRVSEFCRFVVEIDTKTKYLNAKREHFYHGGYNFEETYKSDIQEIVELQKRLVYLLKDIIL